MVEALLLGSQLAVRRLAEARKLALVGRNRLEQPVRVGTLARLVRLHQCQIPKALAHSYHRPGRQVVGCFLGGLVVAVDP